MKQILLLTGLILSMTLHAQNAPKVNLYPNPASTFVRISFSEVVQTDVTVVISDILGNKIETYTFKPSESVDIDLAALNLINGLYLIKIQTGSTMVQKRLLVKHN